MKSVWLAVLALACVTAFAAQPGKKSALPPPSTISPSAPGASVYFIEPEDGATVPSTFTVKFGLKGMTIAPAGTDQPNSGHHHLLIDVAQLPDMMQPLPANDHIVHFGKGQTETTVTLPPGEHTLQLVFANYLHIPHEPPVISKRITVTVSQTNTDTD
jgi:Domain of unknown function (DUF4399)